jgi:hypothetical protein
MRTHKPMMLALGLFLAFVAVVVWRIGERSAMPLPAHVALVIDASDSVRRDCEKDLGVAKASMNARGVRRGSTFAIIRTGDDNTKLEPQMVFEGDIPATSAGGPFNGQRKAQAERGLFLAQAKSACESIKQTKQSPLVKAVRRALVHLHNLGCAATSGCVLVVRSDLQDTDELGAAQAKSAGDAVLDNTGIGVVLCGFSETVSDGAATQTDALLSKWKGLFIEPIRAEPFCGAGVLLGSDLRIHR